MKEQMDTYETEKTISLWDDHTKRKVTLKNIQTGKSFSFTLNHSFVVGRRKDFCDMQISEDDRYMSGKHLRLLKEKDGIYAEDLYTKNGTKINGRLISSRTRVKRGDIIKMGRSEFEITF